MRMLRLQAWRSRLDALYQGKSHSLQKRLSAVRIEQTIPSIRSIRLPQNSSFRQDFRWPRASRIDESIKTGRLIKREERGEEIEESDGNKSNFTDEFPLLNTPTSRINKREQINRVEITKSPGNARRWRPHDEHAPSKHCGLY